MLQPALILLGFIFVAFVILGVRRVRRGHRFTVGEGLQVLGQVPANPSLPGTAYLFPGRGTPPDPDVRETAVTLVDHRPDPSPPAGLKRTDDFI